MDGKLENDISKGFEAWNMECQDVIQDRQKLVNELSSYEVGMCAM